MGKYNFVSTGAMAGDAIEKFLTQRLLLEQQQREKELADKRANEQLELSKRQMAIAEANQKMAVEKAQADQANEAAGTLYSTLGPGEITPGVAGILKKSNKYGGLVESQQTLPSTSMAGALPGPATSDEAPVVPGVLSAPVTDAGGQSFNVLRPTMAQQKEQGLTAARSGIADLYQKGAPRQEIIAALTRAGLEVPPTLLGEDPAINDARDQANELARIKARTEGDLQVARVRAANSGSGGAGGIDYSAVAHGILDGRFPPDINPRSQYGMRLQAEIAKVDPTFNLSDAVSDWRATQRWLQSANSTQQTRLRQALDTSYNSLDLIDSAAQKWKAGRFPAINKAVLATAKSGTMGLEAQSLARQLDGEIAMLQSELAQVSMGGNSPTDHAFELASKALSGDWSEQVLLDMTQLARRNLDMRSNSIRNAGPITMGDNPYVDNQPTPGRSNGPGPGPAPLPPPSAPPQSPEDIARAARQYIDRNRQGR